MTQKLKDELTVLREKFETNEGHQDQRDRNFFSFVKQETEPLFNLIENWYEQTIIYIQQEQIDLYEEQVNATKENFEMLILHSYYVDIRKRRYVEMNRSCLYVFDQLLKELEEKSE